LSGAGIVYKFCSYIDSLLGIKYATDNLIDLAALGIISDMVSLKDFETRHIITKGLSNITNPFFSAMVETQSYSLGEEITPIGVAFYITPYINATIRSGTIEEKIALFEAMLEFKAHEVIPSTKRGCAGQVEERVTQVCRNCANIKNRQAKTRDNNLIIIENLIQEKGLLSNKILVVQLDEEHAIDKNLTGLIAN
jgi:single-stranded-DNA-specific exonuclease